MTVRIKDVKPTADNNRISKIATCDIGDRVTSEDIFGPVISSYTREQAITDGVLIDITATAAEAGFKWPVAITAGAWSKYVDFPDRLKGFQDAAGRLRDIVRMLHCAIKAGDMSGTDGLFKLHVRNDLRERTPPLVTLKNVCGPGDTPEPCITIMLPEED